MSEKIAIAPCSGMSPNGLISRVVCDDLSNENENVVSICMGATSGDRTGFRQLIKKYPIIAINGCDGACVNKILKDREVDVVDTVNIDEELSKTSFKANNTSRLDSEGEKCVEAIKKILLDKLFK